MIVCNKCKAEIVEIKNTEVCLHEDGIEEKTFKRGGKLVLTQVPKRASLVTLPCMVAVNNKYFKDYDLCDKCMSKLNLALDKVRFDFINENRNEQDEQEDQDE